jgi:hypothetical protein
MGNRQAATAELLLWIDKLMPGSPNRGVYETTLAKLSDEEFSAFIARLESKEQILSLVAPNLDDQKLTIGNNLEVAKQLGHNFFERIWMTDPVTSICYLTVKKYLIIDLPLRRQQQLLVKKISIPVDNRHIDELSGQPTGPSKSARVSFPELQVLSAQGMDRSIEELIKFRGGDDKAFRAMNTQIIDTGGANLDSLSKFPTRVKSTVVLSTILKAMMLSNNA